MRINNQLTKLKELENPPQWTKCEKKIIAWSIDWEGCIGLYIHRTKNKEICGLQPKVVLENTNKPLLLMFRSIVKLGNISKRKKHPRRKQMWTWQITAFNECKYLLESILSYLHGKRKQAKIVLCFIQSRIDRGIEKNHRIPYSDRELEYHKIIKELNQRGIIEE